MKKFDLEEAKKGAPLVLRCGLIVLDVEFRETCISGHVLDVVTGGDVLVFWKFDGTCTMENRPEMSLLLDVDDYEKTPVAKSLMDKAERVNHPDHYNTGKIECIDAMISTFGMEQVEVFCRLNAFKYLWRAIHKGHTREDLEKARWYIDKGLQLLNE